ASDRDRHRATRRPHGRGRRYRCRRCGGSPRCCWARLLRRSARLRPLSPISPFKSPARATRLTLSGARLPLLALSENIARLAAGRVPPLILEPYVFRYRLVGTLGHRGRRAGVYRPEGPAARLACRWVLVPQGADAIPRIPEQRRSDDPRSGARRDARAAQPADVGIWRDHRRVSRLLSVQGDDLPLFGAPARRNLCRRARPQDDLHGPDRGLLHLRQGVVLGGALPLLPDRRDTGLEV